MSIQPPFPILSRDQVRALDAYAIEQLGIPGHVLMENAGIALSETTLDHCPEGVRFLVLCGRGNNGGDGYVVARELAAAGCEVHLLETSEPVQLSQDAGLFRGQCARAGIRHTLVQDAGELAACLQGLAVHDVVIDGLLGTGFQGELRPQARGLLQCLNAQVARWSSLGIAIDVPSGLDVDSGEFDEHCFRADLTLTLAADKLAFQRQSTLEVTGPVRVLDIGIPQAAYAVVGPNAS